MTKWSSSKIGSWKRISKIFRGTHGPGTTSHPPPTHNPPPALIPVPVCSRCPTFLEIYLKPQSYIKAGNFPKQQLRDWGKEGKDSLKIWVGGKTKQNVWDPVKQIEENEK